MQILLAWKSEGLSDVEAEHHWTTIVTAWKKKYQPLVDQELQLATTHTNTLFLALLYVPQIFCQWQDFYEHDTYTVAWAGIAYNLLDHIPSTPIEQMNTAFVSQLQIEGDAFLRKLDGRFVTALLSRLTKTLRIITTNNGLTPCFQTSGKYGTAIGTRIAPLIDLVGGEYIPNRSAIIQVCALDWCLGSQTVFENVYQVEPGMEMIFTEDTTSLQEHCYYPPSMILEQARELSHENYLHIGSDYMDMTISQQMRHSDAPLMDLTGGMDSRVIVATALGLGYRPECNVSGSPQLAEVKLATHVAAVMHLPLYYLAPGAHYAENLAETLPLWSLWTEGMAPAHATARSAFALSPTLRRFYAPYRQRFSGLGALCREATYYNNEILVKNFSHSQIQALLFRKVVRNYWKPLLPEDARATIQQELNTILAEAIELGLHDGHHLLDYFYWRERVMRWSAYVADCQHFGRHVFAPLCQSLMYAIQFALRVEEKLAGTWHRYQIQRMFPVLSAIPFLHSPPLSGLRKRVFDIHPMLYKIAWTIKPTFPPKQSKPLSSLEQEQLGSYFHPYLQKLLFSGDEWWPTIIPHEYGIKIWHDFVNGTAAHPLWNLVTFELWAKNFLT